MNIENIKDIWAEENIDTTPEISLEKQKEIHSPLEKIRRNMKIEFWTTIISFPLLLFPIFSVKKSQLVFVLVLFFLMILVTAYYLFKFYTLYKHINTQKFSTYHNLLNLRYELVLNTELYKSYYLSFIPFLFALILFVFPTKLGGTIFNVILIISFFWGAITMYFFGKLWLQEMYGKHIQKISELINELNDEKDDFQYNRSIIRLKNIFSFLSNIRSFLDQKFGKYSYLIYNILIYCGMFILFLITSYFFGYVIGYLGAKYQWFKLEDLPVREYF